MNRLNQQWRQAAAVTGTLALTLLAVQPASAGDRKNYPGSLCFSTPQADDEFRELGSLIWFGYGVAARRIECPLIRDNVNGCPTDVKLYVHDGESGDQFECVFYASNASTGSIYLVSGFEYSGNSFTGNKTLDWNTQASCQAGADKMFGLLCWVPEDGMVHGYSLNEP